MFTFRNKQARRISFNLISAYVVTLFFSALLFFILMYVSSEYFGVASFSQLLSFQGNDGPGPMPLSLYPEPLGKHFFGDFLIIFRISQQASPYLNEGFLPFGYFPFSAIILGPFLLMTYWWALTFFYLTVVLLLAVFCTKFSRLRDSNLTISSSLVIIFASGPALSSFDRGNLSLFVTVFCLFAIFQLKKGNSHSSAVLFGMAAAMKVYPVLFLAIFLRRKDWKSLSIGSFTFCASTLIPLCFYKGGLVANTQEMIQQFIGSSSVEHASKIRAYNNSFFALFDSFGLNFVTDHYLFFLISLSFIAMLFAISQYSSDTHLIIIATLIMVLGPQTVGQYVLLMLLVPIFWLLADSEKPLLYHVIAVVLLAFLMVPKGVPLGLPGSFWSPSTTTFTSTLNPGIGLLLIFITILSVIQRRFINLIQD